MNIAAAFLLAAAVAQTPASAPDRGAQVETAQVSVTILRAVVLKGGQVTPGAGDLPRAQRHVEAGRIAYTFE